MNSFLKLWDKQIFSREFSLKAILSNCDAYLSEYLGKSKKDITGGQFADLVHLIARSQAEGIHTFEQKIVHRLQHIFLNDNAELYVFSLGEILKLYRGFQSLNDYFNKEKVIEAIVEIVLESNFYEDEALLELLKEFRKVGLLEKYQELIVKGRVYFQERFDLMERRTILGFLELFRDYGMLFEDKEVALLMRDHMASTFHAYELSELFNAHRLLSHSFYRDSDTFRIIEDAVKIRAADKEQVLQLQAGDIGSLLSGMVLHKEKSKRLEGSLKSILRLRPGLLAADQRLLVKTVSYLEDFEVKVDEELKGHINDSFKVHLDNLTPDEISHLRLYGKSLLTAENYN
jgi:hypothetical protein